MESKNTKIDSKNLPKDFINSYFFYPNIFQKILSFALLPVSFIYFLIALLLKSGKKKDFNIKIISIGNLLSGGSGKTPFCISLTKSLLNRGYDDIFIILRGYKRASSGLVCVRDKEKILCDVAKSGDEAMLIAQSVPCSVIVSENRAKAIDYAKREGAKLVLLDDGYRFRFVKFDILLEPLSRPCFDFTLPSGYYRFPPSFYKKCDLHLKEGKDYKREVALRDLDSIKSQNQDSINLQNQDSTDSKNKKKYILATAIANPARLEPFLAKLSVNVVYRYFLSDHSDFSENILQNLMQKYNANYILMTQKDYVKCANFSLPIALLDLNLKIDSNALEKIIKFIESN